MIQGKPFYKIHVDPRQVNPDTFEKLASGSPQIARKLAKFSLTSSHGLLSQLGHSDRGSIHPENDETNSDHISFSVKNKDMAQKMFQSLTKHYSEVSKKNPRIKILPPKFDDTGK